MIKVARKKWIYKKSSIMQDKAWIIFSFPFFISVNIYLKIYVLDFPRSFVMHNIFLYTIWSRKKKWIKMNKCLCICSTYLTPKFVLLTSIIELKFIRNLHEYHFAYYVHNNVDKYDAVSKKSRNEIRYSSLFLYPPILNRNSYTQICFHWK